MTAVRSSESRSPVIQLGNADFRLPGHSCLKCLAAAVEDVEQRNTGIQREKRTPRTADACGNRSRDGACRQCEHVSLQRRAAPGRSDHYSARLPECRLHVLAHPAAEHHAVPKRWARTGMRSTRARAPQAAYTDRAGTGHSFVGKYANCILLVKFC